MRSIVLVLALLLIGCGPSKVEQLQSENDDLRSQVSQLQGQLDDMREKAERLETASTELQSQLGRFDSEDWADVVPDAKEAGEEVDSAQQELKQAADE